MMRKPKKIIINLLILILGVTSLSACSGGRQKSFSFNKKINNNSFDLGSLNKNGFLMTFEKDTFDIKDKLQVEVLDNERAIELEDGNFEFLINPMEFNYGEEENIRLAFTANLSIRIPKEYMGDDFDPSDLFFANYYNGKWEYYMPDYIDLEKNTANIGVNHFSFWGFGKPSEEDQIDTYAENVASTNWARQNQRDKMYKQLGRQYEDLFESMGIFDTGLKQELARNAIDYIEDKLYLNDFKGSDYNPFSNPLDMNDAMNEGRGGLQFANTLVNILGEVVFERMKIEPSFFGNLQDISQGLGTAAGAIVEGDTEGALAGIRDAMHTSTIVKVADNLLTFVKESGEYAIDVWTKGEIEKAYRAYAGIGDGKYGYYTGMDGDMNSIFTVLGGGQRSVEMNIVKKYCEKYGIKEKDLSDEMKAKIVKNAYSYLEESFKERKVREPEIQMMKDREKEFIKVLKDKYLLSPFEHRKFFGMDKKGAKFNINERLTRLYRIRDAVISMMDPDMIDVVSDQEIANMMDAWIRAHQNGNMDEFYTMMKRHKYMKEYSKVYPNYYWVLVDVRKKEFDKVKNTKTQLSEGSASIYMTAENEPDIFEGSVTWDEPAKTYRPGETASLKLSANVDTYQWKDTSYPYLHHGLNYVGIAIGAKFDIHDVEIGYGTHGATNFINEDEEYQASVSTDYGKVHVSNVSDTYYAVVPDSGEEGNLIGLHVSVSSVGGYTYIYRLTNGNK